MSFPDVQPTDYYYNAINLMAQHGITAGCGSSTPGVNNYCPGAIVTRYQMAIFIVRAILGSDNFTYSPTPHFTDVPDNGPGFQWIQKMYELGITAGCAMAKYCPNDPATRDQMAVFIMRARYGAAGPPDFPSTPLFGDVPASSQYFRWIQRMGLDSITGGCAIVNNVTITARGLR